MRHPPFRWSRVPAGRHAFNLGQRRYPTTYLAVCQRYAGVSLLLSVFDHPFIRRSVVPALGFVEEPSHRSGLTIRVDLC